MDWYGQIPRPLCQEGYFIPLEKGGKDFRQSPHYFWTTNNMVLCFVGSTCLLAAGMPTLHFLAGITFKERVESLHLFGG